MPKYDYNCPANGRTIEVMHRMSERLTTWGEVCKCAGIEAGDTPADSPVEKVLLAGVVNPGNLGSDSGRTGGDSAFGAGSVAKAYHSTKNRWAR